VAVRGEASRAVLRARRRHRSPVHATEQVGLPGLVPGQVDEVRCHLRHTQGKRQSTQLKAAMQGPALREANGQSSLGREARWRQSSPLCHAGHTCSSSWLS
jgi:hypothetical protein